MKNRLAFYLDTLWQLILGCCTIFCYIHYDQQQQQYEPRTYRSGRPDLGFESNQNISVPPHPGWILLLRFNRDGEPQVRHALTMCNKHTEGDSGRILGMARPHGVRIREGGDSWVTFGRMRYYGGGNWDVQQSPTQDETNYSVLAIYYPSLSRAIQWFDRDSCFKQKDFPTPYTTDCIALPLNSSVDTTFSVPVDDPRQRVARHLRGCWIKRNSIISYIKHV